MGVCGGVGALCDLHSSARRWRSWRGAGGSGGQTTRRRARGVVSGGGCTARARAGAGTRGWRHTNADCTQRVDSVCDTARTRTRPRVLACTRLRARRRRGRSS